MLWQKLKNPIRWMTTGEFNTKNYWRRRYGSGGNSGAGSYGVYARFKADTINRFVSAHSINSVLEFGCGDGNQLSLSNYAEYVGLDVAPEAVRLCIKQFQGDDSKSFFLYDPLCLHDAKYIFHADLVICLEVLFHIVEDALFKKTIEDIFLSADKYVCIFSSNFDDDVRGTSHVRHREFTQHMSPEKATFRHWKLIESIKTPYSDRLADFYFFENTDPLARST